MDEAERTLLGAQFDLDAQRYDEAVPTDGAGAVVTQPQAALKVKSKRSPNSPATPLKSVALPLPVAD